MKIIASLLLLLCALSAQSATNRLVIKRLIVPTFSKTKSLGESCLDMSTSFAATTEKNVFLQAINVGPMFGNTETNQANWPRPGEVRYSSGAGGFTAVSCVVNSTKWLYLFAIMEYVPGYDIPTAPPISSRGKSVKAVTSRKTVKTKNGDVPAGPPMPPAVSVPTKDIKGATRLMLR